MGHSGLMSVTISAEPFGSPESRRLILALDDYLTGLYPPEDNFLDVAADELTDRRGTFLIARKDSVAVGCGAVRRISSTTAEVKRMFVVPSARERGIGGHILVDLEAWAIAAGVTRLVLETGNRQDEAIRLCERFGFVAIPCFGEYADSKQSRCFEKILVPTSTRERPI